MKHLCVGRSWDFRWEDLALGMALSLSICEQFAQRLWVSVFSTMEES